ncbi:MAG: methionyl-tRNA formyltransferase [Blastocatellales bacterium]
MNILLAGEESAGIQTLKAITGTDHHVVAVMASPGSNRLGSATMWQVAENLGLPVWPAKLVKDAAFARQVRRAEVDILFNVHSLHIINSEVIGAPRIGCFNLHPGPLPRYAGLNAPNWAIFRGETSHGVTVHKMEPDIDTGHIVYQSLFNIGENDTALSVSTSCIREGVAMMIRLLETAADAPSAIPLIPQDLSRREYFKAGAPAFDGLFRSLPARQFVNYVRASDYYPLRGPWESPRVKLGNRVISIVKASLTGIPSTAPAGAVGGITGSGARVACIDEWVNISKLIVEGRYLNASEALNSGDQLEDVTND